MIQDFMHSTLVIRFNEHFDKKNFQLIIHAADGT